MGINSTEVSYGFGQMGSVFTDTAAAAITPPTGKVFVAITFLADTQLEILSTGAGGLTAQNDITNGIEYIGTDVAAHDAVLSPDLGESGAGGKIIDNANTFPKGVTIYGRFTSVMIGNGKTGALIAYIGN
tara:strand:- start:116 stop:505 length:390 start_codon:yes stop_codon:yes gene_type:complete